MEARIDMGIREIVLQDLIRYNERVSADMHEQWTKLPEGCFLVAIDWEECFEDMWLEWVGNN